MAFQGLCAVEYDDPYVYEFVLYNPARQPLTQNDSSELCIMQEFTGAAVATIRSRFQVKLFPIAP